MTAATAVERSSRDRRSKGLESLEREDSDRIVEDLINGRIRAFNPASLGAMAKPESATGIDPGEIPTDINQLSQQLSRTYDLSVTAAVDLKIPVIGSVSGGYNRRVVVLERIAYKELQADKTTYQYGYAVRLGVTVNKLTSETKLTLPFLAASAEVGRIEAQWVMQVVGLAGSKIDSEAIAPTELNVETFVLAKQSLGKIIAAIHDPETRFTAALIGVQRPSDSLDREFATSIGRAYALGRLEKGRRLADALGDIDGASSQVIEAVQDTYRDLAGISDQQTEPSAAVRARARQFLGEVKVEPR